MSVDESEIAVDEKPAYRLESKWTDEATAHRLRDILVDAGVDPDKLVIGKRLIEVDAGP